MKLLRWLCCLGLSAGAVAADNADLEKRIEVLSEEVQNLREKGTSANQLHFGGYGEFTYTNTRSELEDGTKQGVDPVWDAHRWILYAGYDFNQNWKMHAEIEIEHAKEIYLEQAAISYHHSKAFNFNVGVLLVPVGITNVYHEPTTFLAVERPRVDNSVIPTTWRENGVSVNGEYSSLRYELALVNGLDASKFSNSGVRSGRQKASKANARDLAWAGRLDYLLGEYGYVGASAYMGKAGGVLTDVSHNVVDVHADLKFKAVQFRGMYASLTLDNTKALNEELGKTDDKRIAKAMNGYFFELGYDLLHGLSEHQLIPFVRYEGVNTAKDYETAGLVDVSMEKTYLTYGLNYKPLSNLVFKADYTVGKNKAKTGYDTWNLGVGWNF